MTFGNIGGGESPVAGVHAIKADIKEIDESSETPTAQEEVPGSSAEVMVARCVIESTCFDAPAGYREVNLDQPVGEFSQQCPKGGFQNSFSPVAPYALVIKL